MQKIKKLFINNLGDLAESQRASFYRFLITGIEEELKQLDNPFLSKIKPPGTKKVIKVLVYFYGNTLKMKGPNQNLEKCREKGLSYTFQVYLGTEYSYPFLESYHKLIKQNQSLFNKFLKREPFQVRVKQHIFLAELPLMTDEGTFFINGCERVVISQIIRSPGVYFRKEFGKSSKRTKYTATIISNKGLWTKFILDNDAIDKSEQDRVYIQLSEFKRKLSLSTQDRKRQKELDKSDESRLFVFDFLKYFGLTLEEIADTIKYPKYFAIQQLKGRVHKVKVKKKRKRDPQIVLVYRFERDNYDTLLLIDHLFANRGRDCFSLGQIGRYKANKNLGLNLPKNVTYLTSQDFIGILNGLIELKYLDRANDDIDDIRNKLVRSIGELLQLQIRMGISKLQKQLFLDSKQVKEPGNKNFFFDLEQNNEIVEVDRHDEDVLMDPRIITSVVRDFFKTSQLSQYMDQINPLSEITHKRRISVFGPNGLKRDHVSMMIRDIHPSQYSRLCPIETPEGKNAGLINTLTLLGRINSLGALETPYFFISNGQIHATKEPIFLNPHQEFQTKVAFGDIAAQPSHLLIEQYISVKENYLFSLQKTKKINFLTLSPLQIVSVATSLIPFLEHDDANRALMGSNMQRQAVPLLYLQKPIVGTGLEAAIILDSGMILKSYCQGEVVRSSALSIEIKDKVEQILHYRLKKYLRSNQETSMHQRPVVWPGEIVFSNQVIADGPSTLDGELALGRNLLIAYMPWEGYNYEDAIIINERILVDDCLTSVHIEEYEINLTPSFTGSEKFTKKLSYLTKYIRRHLDKNGIVRMGSFVKEHDILIGKATVCEEPLTPERRLLKALLEAKKGKKAKKEKQDEKKKKKEKKLDNLEKTELLAIRAKKEKKKKRIRKNYKDSSLRATKNTFGRVIDIRIFSTLQKENDPSTFFSNSRDILRISIAQIRKLRVGDKLAGRHGNKGIVSRILPRQDMPYLPDGTAIDIVFNPLGVPSRMNVGQIFECLLGFAGEKIGNRFKVFPFDEIYGKEASRVLINQKLKEGSLNRSCHWLFDPTHPGKILLRDGRTGEFFDNPITVGKSYILKLIHLVEDKIHARATGPYALITEQPLAGKSQRGGQRFGEMEVWALEAFGCSHTLQELLTIKSDEIDGRHDIYEAILMRKDIPKPIPSIPESFLALIRELHSLGLDFSLKKINGSTKCQEKDIFQYLEVRLKLRALLARQKLEQLSLLASQEEDDYFYHKEREKKKLIEEWKIKN